MDGSPDEPADAHRPALRRPTLRPRRPTPPYPTPPPRRSPSPGHLRRLDSTTERQRPTAQPPPASLPASRQMRMSPTAELLPRHVLVRSALLVHWPGAGFDRL